MSEARGRPALLQRIAAEIRGQGPISFARFMELALYDPEQGYYGRDAGGLGTGGDYFTASDVGRAFGRCMARQIVDVDRRIGPFDPFHVVEFGSGRGLLARDILEELRVSRPALASRLRYWMVDRSPAMRDESRRRASGARALAPEELAGPCRGCVLAVELFDALPVHRVRRRDGALVEVHVDVASDGRLVERERPAAAGVAALAARYGAAPEEGTEAEVAPQSGVLLETMAGVLERGVLIIVDYGATAEELYRGARKRGTLLAYHRHGINEDYLDRVGEQDLTAHVNFTALEERGREIGLHVLGRTTQERFLIANGILECFEERDERRWRDPRRVRERLRVKQLIQPAGMGRVFQVLILAKGGAPATLAGLRDPFATGRS